MNRLLTTISIVTLLASCNQASNTNKQINNIDTQKNEATKTPSPVDTTPKVIGIGGVFFYSDNPKETNAWYSKNLGVEINNWGSSSFDYRNAHGSDEVISLQWKPFKK